VKTESERGQRVRGGDDEPDRHRRYSRRGEMEVEGRCKGRKGGREGRIKRGREKRGVGGRQ